MDRVNKAAAPMSRISTGISRIHWHWTAGGPFPNATDMEAYHLLIDQNGQIHHGKYRWQDNVRIIGDAYSKHTRGANTGALSVSLCGMTGARERPFSPGPAPITELQVDAMVELTALLNRQHGITPARKTNLSHAEVPRSLGIWQKQKWDITWLPGMNAVGDAIAIGDDLRRRVTEAMM